MKKLNLICNSHLDPVWLWSSDEGKGAVLSTFNSIVNLLDRNDFFFCHSESYLYEFVKEISPTLYKRIQKHVKNGKWIIIGGWYIQPDCLMPHGEVFVRIAKEGKMFFKKEFGKTPRYAVNFDAFGHSKGLVQILAKTGSVGEMACRPHFDFWPAKSNWIEWKGFADTKVKVFRDPFHYSSEMGKTIEKINNEIKYYDELGKEEGFCLWGVGDHGGGPSQKDLDDIVAFNEKNNILVHSDPEKVFDKFACDEEYDKSLITVFPGCYSSVREYKEKYSALESKFFYAEKMASVANIYYGVKYPQEKLDEIEKIIMFGTFHDILPGTASENGMTGAIESVQHGLDIANNLISDMHLKLALELKPCAQDKIPVCVFNPLPYRVKRITEVEFILPSIHLDTNDCIITVKDSSGKTVNSQRIKEGSNFNVQWHKKIAFECDLDAFSTERYDVEFSFGNEVKNEDVMQDLSGVSFYAYSDNEDPWGQDKSFYKSVGQNPEPVELVLKRIVEKGNLFVVYEKIYEYGKSKVVLNERHYHNSDDVDLDLRVYWNDRNRVLKMHIASPKGEYIGQIPYGTETLYDDGRECCAHRFTAVKSGNKLFAVVNNGVYGSSYNGKEIMISLLRSGAYSAHPATEEDGTVRPLIDSNRFIPPFDQGLHRYKFKICNTDTENVNRIANEFNQQNYAVFILPIGTEDCLKPNFNISNTNITLITIKKSKETKGFIIRLMNNTPKTAETKLGIKQHDIEIKFKPYEVKTVIYNKCGLTEVADLVV